MLEAKVRGNRRRHYRAKLGTLAQCLEGRKLQHVRIQNISEGGMRVEGIDQVNVHTFIKIFFPIINGGKSPKLYTTEAEVVWVADRTAGISFVFPPEETVEQIRRYLEMDSPRG